MLTPSPLHRRSMYLAALLLPSLSAQAGNLANAGDALRLALPLTALGSTLLHQDRDGARQWLYSTGTTVLLTWAGKKALADSDWGSRPDGTAQGFPSGHAALACSGAAFMQERYGWRWGAPAYAAASWVAWSRVESGAHRWRDVLAGCALAAAAAQVWVTPYLKVTVVPVLNATSAAVSFSAKF